jgi:DNA-directed RNA polymerase specialized sigma24 family protein
MGDGDRQRQFLELVTRHQRVLHKVCNLYAGGPGDRQDLREEILLQLWRSCPSYRGDAAVTTCRTLQYPRSPSSAAPTSFRASHVL